MADIKDKNTWLQRRWRCWSLVDFLSMVTSTWQNWQGANSLMRDRRKEVNCDHILTLVCGNMHQMYNFQSWSVIHWKWFRHCVSSTFWQWPWKTNRTKTKQINPLEEMRCRTSCVKTVKLRISSLKKTPCLKWREGRGLEWSTWQTFLASEYKHTGMYHIWHTCAHNSRWVRNRLAINDRGKFTQVK